MLGGVRAVPAHTRLRHTVRCNRNDGPSLVRAGIARSKAVLGFLQEQFFPIASLREFCTLGNLTLEEGLALLVIAEVHLKRFPLALVHDSHPPGAVN